MEPETATKSLNVELHAIHDIINQIQRPACLVNCDRIMYANARCNKLMGAVDHGTLTDGAEVAPSKEVVINNSIFLARRIRLNSDVLFVTLTERKGVEVSTDPLTGLLNRDSFESLFSMMLENANSNNQIMSVLFVDLDGFKSINDNYGHEKGDIVLKAVAERLVNTVRNNDLCFRLGGDEFVVLLSDVKDRLHPCLLARRLIHSICKDIELDGSRRAKVGASIGIASFPHDGNDFEELLKKADNAMYRAKRLGKNNYQLFGQ